MKNPLRPRLSAASVTPSEMARPAPERAGSRPRRGWPLRERDGEAGLEGGGLDCPLRPLRRARWRGRCQRGWGRAVWSAVTRARWRGRRQRGRACGGGERGREPSCQRDGIAATDDALPYKEKRTARWRGRVCGWRARERGGRRWRALVGGGGHTDFRDSVTILGRR